MHPDPLTTISAFLSRWAARQDDPDRALPIPTLTVCALRLTSAIVEKGGAHAAEDFAALWHHAGRPPVAPVPSLDLRHAPEGALSLNGRLRRVAIITAGPVAAWTIYEGLSLGTLSISSRHLIEAAAACGAASLTAQTPTRREALAAFAATLPSHGDPMTCTLCGATIPDGAPTDSWLSEDEDGEERDLHAHPGCERIRLEVDADEWETGALPTLLAEWLEDGDSGAQATAWAAAGDCEYGRAVVRIATRRASAGRTP